MLSSFDILKEEKNIKCQDLTVQMLFTNKFKVDFSQRDYVWETKQIEDLVSDLSIEFLKNWSPDDSPSVVQTYNPYFMGEIILSSKDGSMAVIDGQQRITSITLLMIYLLTNYGDVEKFPVSDIKRLIYSDYFGEKKFNLDIDDRNACMLSLFERGAYIITNTDSASVQNITSRYSDFQDCWNPSINRSNVVHFTYWLMNKVVFSQVITNNDEFAYVIFETMNDRGLSLTQTEMLRSYLLAHIDESKRNMSMQRFADTISALNKGKTGKQNIDLEFFKFYFRAQMAEGSSQTKDSNSDFQLIGKGIHRWVKNNEARLGLLTSDDYVDFIDRIRYYADVYVKLLEIISSKNSEDYLYVIVNNDYGFTLQPEPLLACVCYKDDDVTVLRKIHIVSKYRTKVLSWFIWRQKSTAQSYLESPIFELCKLIRNKPIEELETILEQEPIDIGTLDNVPMLNQQNNRKFRVLIALITEIVARESGTPDYMLNHKNIEIEHIWSDHFEQHRDEFDQRSDFVNARNSIGDLLVLPKEFNESYNDSPYEAKAIHYIEQNILAQSLNPSKYENNPGFLSFIRRSGLGFRPYSEFKLSSIRERTQLYCNILLWNWGKLDFSSN